MNASPFPFPFATTPASQQVARLRANAFRSGTLPQPGLDFRTGTMPAFGQPAPQQDMGGGGSFGMGKPTQGPIDAHIGAPDPFAPDPNWDPTGTPYAPDKRKAGQFAGGGMVEGPGGPKDDLIPAKLSDGEFVMPAEAVKFFGLDKLHKMTQKAREGLMEIPDGANQPGTGNPEPGTAPMPHMACGGPVKKYAAGGFVNPYADDPMAAALAEQRGKDERLAAIGAQDMGGGNISMANRYGTGFAVPQIQGLPDAPGRFNDMQGGTVTATPGQGLTPVPDIVPAGSPWAAPSLPDDPSARRAQIQTVGNQMATGAPLRRQEDLDTAARRLALQPKGRAMITVPDATWKPAAASSPATFQAPWEKDAAARELRDQSLVPGMNRTESRRFLKTPQGVEFSMKQKAAAAKGPANQAMPVINADGTRSATHQMVNGQVVKMNEGTDDLPKRLKELDALIADKKQPLHIRELARRERDIAARETIKGGGEFKAPKLAQVPGSAASSFMPVSVQWDAKTGGWTPIQMATGKSGAAPAGAPAQPAANPAADRIAALRARAGLK